MNRMFFSGMILGLAIGVCVGALVMTAMCASLGHDDVTEVIIGDVRVVSEGEMYVTVQMEDVSWANAEEIYVPAGMSFYLPPRP